MANNMKNIYSLFSTVFTDIVTMKNTNVGKYVWSSILVDADHVLKLKPLRLPANVDTTGELWIIVTHN